jgi:hypothetical protein
MFVFHLKWSAWLENHYIVYAYTNHFGRAEEADFEELKCLPAPKFLIAQMFLLALSAH